MCTLSFKLFIHSWFYYIMLPSNIKIFYAVIQIYRMVLCYKINFCTLMAQDNFSISQQTNFNDNKLLRKNIFNINKNKTQSFLQIKQYEHLIFHKQLDPVLIIVIFIRKRFTNKYEH